MRHLPPSTDRSMLRPTAIVIGTLVSLLVSAPRAESQATSVPASPWEFRVASGAFVPTGALRASVKNAELSAVQLSWAMSPSLAVTATVGWARSRDAAASDAPKLDVFTADLGVEARGGQWRAGRAMTFSPFIGAGAGAQSYNYRKLDIDATNNAGAYGSVGGTLGLGRLGVRLEMRDYVSGFKPLNGIGTSSTRNNVVMMVALRFNRARPSATK